MPAQGLITAEFWPEPVQLLSASLSAYGFATVEAVGAETGRHYSTVLPVDRWQAVGLTQPRVPDFRAAGSQFRLAIEAERLTLAYSCDPLIATNNSRVDVVPHQIEAVYGAMLPQPIIRHLMAHDAGAGKTVMAGLLYKELRLRQPDLRTLIVAPAALVPQWQRELEEKFLEAFQVVDREQLRKDPGVWASGSRLVTSISFAEQPDVVASLANVPWDLVIVDEAHHMAAYERNSTRAYKLGQVLSRQARHLVLATATPHKGDPINFLRLLQLLDPGLQDTAVVNRTAADQVGGPLMLRRLKEEMVDFQGQPLYKPRVVETRWHQVADNRPEMELYTALTEYVSKTYRAAERLGGREKVNTRFAMSMLQRRMNSSLVALERSLERRRLSLLGVQSADSELPPADLEQLADLAEWDRWQIEEERELSTPSKTKHERRREAAEIAGLLEKIATVRATGEETKVTALRRLLDDAGIMPQTGGEKLLVFTEFKDTLDFLEVLFHAWGFTTTHIDGSMNPQQRRRAEAEFRDRVQVMVATEAAGEGVNLQFCAFMVNYDLPWVPTRLEQRMGRIHRYGQTRVAHIYNLAAADTREGMVVAGLLERLEKMRGDLGEQVFDVISVLVGDTDLEDLLSDVALAPTTDASQEAALKKLLHAMDEGAERYRRLLRPPTVIDPERFRQMQQASRQSRLTPDYAQHFLVDALEALGEHPLSDQPGTPAGYAAVIRWQPQRRTVADALSVPAGEHLRLSFQSGKLPEGVRFAALGTPILDGALRLVHQRWGETLSTGALFLDPALPPGDRYLLWFLVAQVVDGTGAPVEAMPLAVRQNLLSGGDRATFASAPASALIDLIAAPPEHVAPSVLLGLARDPQPAVDWSLAHQQLPLLASIGERRAGTVSLRRDSLLAEAERSLAAAQDRQNDLSFADTLDGEPNPDLAAAELAVAQAKARVQDLAARFDREQACSLARPRLLGVAAVVSLHSGPDADVPDLRPDIAAAAQAIARRYEEDHGRQVTDVSGEHELEPYDLRSTGPGGTRCIEVKGVTTGPIILTENERRAAHRLGPHYYLYIVAEPLGRPRLTIVHDPLSKMHHDHIMYSGARYAFDSATWRAAADEEIEL